MRCLINRLSNEMKKCEQGEELLVKVLSLSRHHEGITGPAHTASASEQWRHCTMNMEVHINMHQRRAASKRQKEKAETLQCGHTVCASDQHFPSVSSFHNLS